MSTGPAIPSALERFIDLFNRGRFWDSHEALEGAWRENGSAFYKGLILFASAFVHVQRGNAHGVVAQLRKARRHLEPYRPAYLGIDVDALLARAAELRAAVTAADSPADWTARVGFPRLTPDPARIRGDEPELAGGSS